MLNSDKLEQIERYLTNELSDSEKEIFDTQKSNNTEYD